MRYWCICVCLCVPAAAFAEVPPNVRPADQLAGEILAEAKARSAIVRRLIAELRQTNVIVHVMTGPLPIGVGGTTRFAASRGGYRYLRITIAAKLPCDLRLVLLGHELEHAREIAESQAGDVAGLFRLFESRGYRTGPASYETMSAVRVEQAIWRELQTQPVIQLHHEHLRAAGAKSAAEIAKR